MSEKSKFSQQQQNISVTDPVPPGYINSVAPVHSNYVPPNRTAGPYIIGNDRGNAVAVDMKDGRESVPIPDNFGHSFDSVAIRHKFIRKVYAIVTVELLITFITVAVFSLHEPMKLFVQRNLWVLITAYVVFLVTYFTLICSGNLRRKWPFNMIFLAVFTLSMSYILGSISAFYETELVFFAIGVTALLAFLLTLFAMQTKYDFTGVGIYLYVCVWLLFVFGILAIIFQNKAMQMLYSFLLALLFSCYLVYDTQCIVGRGKLKLSEEEHIFGALMLYYDVVMIFLAILGLSKD